MAQKYVDDLSRNVKRGLKTKAEMGWFPGPTPSGYLNRTHPDGRKTIASDPKHFPIVRKCSDLITVFGFRTVNAKPMARNTIYTSLPDDCFAHQPLQEQVAGAGGRIPQSV